MRDKRPLLVVLQIIFLIMAIVSLVYAVLYNTVLRRTSDMPHHCVVLTEWERVYDDGSREKITLPVRLNSAVGEKTVIETVIPDACCDNDYVAFFNIRDAKMYVNDELRLEFYRDSVKIRGGLVKGVWLFIPVNASDVGATLRIVRDGTDSPNGIYKEMYLGDLFGIVWENMKLQGLEYIASALLVLLSFCLILAGFVMRGIFKHKIPIIDFAIGLMLAALWVQFDAEINQFLLDNRYVDGVLGYLSILLMPYPVISYVDEMQKERHTKMLNAVKAFSILYALIFSFCHFAEIYNFETLMPSLIAGHSIMIVLVLVTIILDIVEGHVREYKLIAIGALVFLIVSAIEVLNLAVFDFVQTGVFFLIGLYSLFITGLIQQIHELIEADRARRRALAANEQKTNFLANMSHEIRTPINSIIGMNEMILRECKDPAIREYAGHVSSSGKMLLGLVNDILDFSKIEAGRMDIIEAEYHTSEMIADLETILKDRALAKNLKCNFEVDSSIPSVMSGDDFHIRQIVVNLISNAVKYTNEGSISFKVSTTSSVHDGYVDLRFAVTDTGIGIRKDNLEKLFETFTRVEESRSRSIEGTGLGLSIVKKLTEAMSGTVRVESEYGIGSTFTVEIPQNVVDYSPIGDRIDFSEAGRSGLDYRELFRAPQAEILVVDDNAVNLKVVKELLKSTEIKIDTASGGRECVMKCRDRRYDLILMDHRMPDPDGIATLHLLRDDFEGLNADTKVIVLTANAYSGLKELYASEGFDDYLTKPVDSKLLEACIMKHLPQSLVIRNTVSIDENPAPEQVPNPAPNPAATIEQALGFADRMRSVEGMDYDAAVQKFGADEKFMKSLMETVVSDGRNKIELMRSYLAAHDYNNFGIEAHAAKSTMATIAAAEISEHARKHEFAAKEGRNEYIDEDGQNLLDEYSDMLNRIETAMRGEE